MKNLTTDTTPAGIAHQALQRIIHLGGAEIKIPKPENIDDAKSQALQLIKQRDDNSILIGFLLILIKKSLVHGKWVEWLAENGLDRRRASEDMMIARTVKQYEEKGINLLGVGKMLLIESSRHPIEEIADVIDDVGMEKYKDLSVPELHDLLNKREQTIRNTAEENSTLKKQRDDANRAKDSCIPNPEFGEYATKMRKASNAFADKSILCIDSLHDMFDKHMQRERGVGKSVDFDMGSDIVTRSLYFHAQAIAARSAELVMSMRNQLGFANEQVKANLIFREEEINEAVRNRKLMVAAHKQEELIAGMVEVTKKRGPKPKNKSNK